jgi:hypothetical protein
MAEIEIPPEAASTVEIDEEEDLPFGKNDIDPHHLP